MNDDQTPELELIAASAYLDGVATADERATVEASPELMAMVETWRALRDRTVEVPVSAANRERAIAAAMMAFDEVHAPRAVTAVGDGPRSVVAAGAPAAEILRFERRRRQSRLVFGAAAAVVFVIGGLALLRPGSGNDDLESSSTASKELPAATEAPAIAMEAPTTLAAATELAPAPASADVAVDTEAPAAGAAPADTEAPSADSETVDPNVAATMQTVDGPDELLAYYESTRTTNSDPEAEAELPTTSQSSCVADTDQVIGDVVYGGRPVLVVLVLDGTELRAIDPATCAVLLTTSP